MSDSGQVSADVRALVRASAGCTLLLSSDLTVQAVSDSYLRMLGVADDKIVGRDIRDALAGSDSLEALIVSLQTVLRTGQPHEMAPGLFRAAASAGSDRLQHLLEIVNSPVVGANGSASCLLHQAREPVSRTEPSVAAALDAAEARLRSILRTVPDAMIIIDQRGLIESLSTTAERLFGYTADELAGRNVSLLMPSPDRERHDGYLKRYLTTGDRHIIGIGRVVVGQRKDGTTFPLHLTVGELRTGNRHHFTGFIRDLTDQQLTEKRLKELQSEVTHMSRFTALGEMASTLAHEINQPLTAINNYLRGCHRLLQQAEGEPAPALRDALAKASDQALRAGQIIRRLREFVARGDSERASENLSRLIEDASTLALIGTRENAIAVSFRLDPRADRVLVDRIQIQQVLVNLMRNAVDVLAESANVREILIESRLAGDGMVELAVADSGPGLAPEVRTHLFQPFVTTKQKGMGLGLSICRTIVEAHGGRIWVEDRPQGGTIFRFTLRLAGSEPEEAALGR